MPPDALGVRVAAVVLVAGACADQTRALCGGVFPPASEACPLF